ncbi:MAG: aspartate aminotransferase family protein [Candidatus Chisholmbacteria bacterium]|nr:aspartate aminotransferase family protein [Candidatus Chisholmbacteria bacterium]
MIKKQLVYSEYSKWRFDVSRAQGEFLWDSEGKKYIDFTSGWNVTNLGWNHPEITQALVVQAKKSNYVPMWTADPMQNEYAKTLTNSLPKGLDTVLRATGGTEANEEALKTARAYTEREIIVGFKNTYHGQSFGTLAIGNIPQNLSAISPVVGGFRHIEFPRTDKSKDDKQVLNDFEEVLDKALSKKDVAAIVAEAGIITGWGSTYVAPMGFLKLLREKTKQYSSLLILDEVGTGFSRCGKLFGMQIEEVTPDIVTFAKGISNGAAAIGATVTTNKIAEKGSPKARIVSTFGWLPTACAVTSKTLEIHKRDKVWEKAKKDGRYIIQSLQRELKKNGSVVEVRGIGMEIGVELKEEKTAVNVVAEAERKGLHLVSDTDRNIQLMPPLTIPRSSLDKGIDILVSTINRFA